VGITGEATDSGSKTWGFLSWAVHYILWNFFHLGQSKDAGRKAVEYAAMLLTAYKEAKKKVEELRERIAVSSHGVQDLTDQLADAVHNSKHLQERYHRKRRALGVDGRLSLQKLEGDQYLYLRINAQILKRRIRDRLHNRKFEMEKVERAYRRSSSGKLFQM